MNSESVIIHNFWSGRHGRPIVFHKRSDPGTACDPENSKRLGLYTCGHALPRDVAEKIAQPCRRCYPVTVRRLDEVRDDGAITHKMCCVCFKMVPVEDLWVDAEGQKWDLCSQACADAAGVS